MSRALRGARRRLYVSERTMWLLILGLYVVYFVLRRFG